MEMTYEEANLHKQKLEETNKKASDALKVFDKYKSTMGLVPDHIRNTPEWKKAKQAYDSSFSELRKFNGWYVKNFRKKKAVR